MEKLKLQAYNFQLQRSVFANIKELEEYGVVLKSNRCHTLVISQIEFFSLVLVKQIRL
jgi:hypothetical protein